MSIRCLGPAIIAASLFLGDVRAADTLPAAEVSRPDTRPADTSRPVKVFLIMGQSNAVGMAPVSAAGKGVPLEKAVFEQKLYPFLVDETGHWLERKDVRYTQVMTGRNGGMNVLINDWLVPKTKTMGIEYGVGAKVGNALEEPVLILKSCIGNRALGWDLLPPNSESSEYTVKDKKTGTPKTYVYAGYKDPTEKWEKGTEPAAGGKWYAGKQYDDDVANAKKVLADLGKHYPGADRYEVVGFFWWQGERDCGDEGHSAMYEKNLVNLIKSLRKDFDAPHAKFV
ncbi:MAG TPA: sialate O-acetylesterase, partial [Roseimicrobium sp.]|nr:sialate O-acetylesterase [Roseimicrobium sp.]